MIGTSVINELTKLTTSFTLCFLQVKKVLVILLDKTTWIALLLMSLVSTSIKTSGLSPTIVSIANVRKKGLPLGNATLKPIRFILFIYLQPQELCFPTLVVLL